MAQRIFLCIVGRVKVALGWRTGAVPLAAVLEGEREVGFALAAARGEGLPPTRPAEPRRLPRPGAVGAAAGLAGQAELSWQPLRFSGRNRKEPGPTFSSLRDSA